MTSFSKFLTNKNNNVSRKINGDKLTRSDKLLGTSFIDSYTLSISSLDIMKNIMKQTAKIIMMERIITAHGTVVPKEKQMTLKLLHYAANKNSHAKGCREASEENWGLPIV